jgi:hypothetical protein
MMYGNHPPGYADLDFPLQGMDFLQGVEGMGQGLPGMGGIDNPQSGLDLGFGLGWEGMDHDFSDGNQLDLFDGITSPQTIVSSFLIYILISIMDGERAFP